MIIAFDEPLWDQYPIGGVYVIFNRWDVPVYCGQSSNIKERLAVHKRWVGDDWYARMIYLSEDLEERMKVESEYHSSTRWLISRPTNGRHRENQFDGIIFDSISKRNEYVRTVAAKMGITFNSSKSFNGSTTEELFEHFNNIQDSRSRAISASNKKRTGQKLKMKVRRCPHCGTEGKGGNMSRYHFDNCKER